MKRYTFAIIMLSLLLFTSPSFAEQSLSLSGGTVTRNMDNAGSQAWQVEYRADPFLTPPFGVALSYTNEEPAGGHKRDEVAAKILMIVPVFDRFQISAGVGPVRYNDTTISRIQRGWGAVYGTSAAYRLTKNLSVIASWDRVEISGDGESDLFLLGAKFSWK